MCYIYVNNNNNNNNNKSLKYTITTGSEEGLYSLFGCGGRSVSAVIFPVFREEQ